MAGVGGKVALPKFRETFKVVHKEAVQWFPGHMRKGLRQMQNRLKDVDCVIEVHDARVPLSGRFTEYRNSVSGIKPHIFVLNKKDLAIRSYDSEIRDKLADAGVTNVLFTNFRDQTCTGLKSILPLATKLILASNRYNRSNKEDYAIMIIGVPNVGKSSLINRMRNLHLHRGNASAVGAVPGITRSLLTRIKINEKPGVYLLDTPGILEPQVRSIETGLKLAAVNCLQDHLVGPETIADFVLFWLNKNGRFEYVEKMGLPRPTDQVLELLTLIAHKANKMQKLKNYDGRYMIRPDFLFAAQTFLKAFRLGEFGPVCLDNDILSSQAKDYD